MNEPTLNQEFNFYFNLLSEGQKKTLLSTMKSLLNKTKDNSERVSVVQYNNELKEAEERITSGEFISQQSLREESN